MKIARAALHHKQRCAFLSSLWSCSGIALQRRRSLTGAAGKEHQAARHQSDDLTFRTTSNENE